MLMIFGDLGNVLISSVNINKVRNERMYSVKFFFAFHFGTFQTLQSNAKTVYIKLTGQIRYHGYLKLMRQ